MKVFSYLDEADIPLEQSWAWVRSRQVLGEVISRSNGNFLTFQSTIGFSSTFHIHIHLQKSMVAWPCNPSLYFCEIGDDLMLGDDRKWRINNAFLQPEKYVFQFLGQWRSVRQTEKRLRLAVWGLYHLGSHSHYTWVWSFALTAVYSKYASFSLHSLLPHSQPSCFQFPLVWGFSYDRMEMHLPSSWTRENVNTNTKLSSDSCSSSDIELRECETTKS
jgi:hypothetical protein